MPELNLRKFNKSLLDYRAVMTVAKNLKILFNSPLVTPGSLNLISTVYFCLYVSIKIMNSIVGQPIDNHNNMENKSEKRKPFNSPSYFPSKKRKKINFFTFV